MKKSISIALLFGAFAFISYGQTWSTSLNSGASLKLGTSSNHAFDIYTNNIKQLSLSTDGVLNFQRLTGTENRFVYIDASGNLRTTGGSDSGIPGRPCSASALPWYLGGNNSPANNTIGTCSSTDFILKSNNNQSIFLKTNGYVGIGLNNSSPQAALDIWDGTTPSTAEHLKIYGDSYGTIESTSDMSLLFKAGGYLAINDANTPNGAQFWMQDGTVGIGGLFSIAGTKLGVIGRITAINGSSSDEMLSVFNTSGNKAYFSVFGSGKTNIGNQVGMFNSAFLNLNVDGGVGGIIAFDIFDKADNRVNFRVKSSGYVYAREIKVTNVTPFPDYVFESDYQLLSLAETESYYKKYKHLPEIPSADEVKDGFELGEMNKMLLKKIEELTIHMVEQQKHIDKLEEIVVELKERKRN